MALEAVKAFYEEVAKNGALQKKIAAADAAYAGDAEDKAAAAAAILLPIAKEAGFDFTAEELLGFENAAVSEGEFTEDELEAVAGGAAFCFFIGFGKKKNGKAVNCNIVGFGTGYEG